MNPAEGAAFTSRVQVNTRLLNKHLADQLNPLLIKKTDGDTLYDWEKRFPEFEQAKKIAYIASSGKPQIQTTINLKSQNFN